MIKLNAFTPYALSSSAFYDWCVKAAKSKPERILEILQPFLAVDPGATDWSSVGLVNPIEKDRPVHNLDGTACMLMFQFNERILPASVRDEKVSAEFQRLIEKEGRELNKKEYAQIKEDVEMALLPKAFIRRSLVPVMVFKDCLMIFTTSAKKCETVITRLGVIANTRNFEYAVNAIETQCSIGFWLREMVVDGDYEPDSSDIVFGALDYAKFKGQDKRTITIRERDIAHHEVQDILKEDGYGVTELKMDVIDLSGEELLTYTFTDRFVFKGIRLSDMTMTRLSGDTDDRHATAWLHAKTYRELLNEIVLRLNELKGDDADQAAAAATETDDL